MERVLVLSSHSCLDRRIIAEVNTLAESGRAVTLLNVPGDLARSCLDPRVHVRVGPTLKSPAKEPLPPRAAKLRECARWWRPTAARLAKKMLPRTVVAMLRRLGPSPIRPFLNDLLAYFSRHAPEERIDVIHCHDLETLPAAIDLRARRYPGAHLIYDSHEYYPYQIDDPAFQFHWSNEEARCIHEADLVITVNPSIAELMANRYGIPCPAVLYNSHSLLNETPSILASQFCDRFQAPASGFRLLFQGGLTEYRNLPNLVRAMAQLDDSFRLFVIGTGPKEREMRELQSELRIHHLHFGGWIEQHELLAYTRHAHLGVIPCISEAGLLSMQYCTPNKLFEYIEAEIPICSNNLPEITRIVSSSGIGRTYTMETPEQIARALRDCRARCERGEFTLQARQAARQQYSWKLQGQHLLQLYDRLHQRTHENAGRSTGRAA